MTPGNLADPDGARKIVASYATLEGAFFGIFIRQFRLFFYIDPDNGKFQTGQGSHKQSS